jgi:hypothetical protein
MATGCYEIIGVGANRVSVPHTLPRSGMFPSLFSFMRSSLPMGSALSRRRLGPKAAPCRPSRIQPRVTFESCGDGWSSRGRW